MITRTLFALAFLPAPNIPLMPVIECPAPCVKKLTSDKPVNCEAVTMNMVLMFYAFDKWGPMASPEVCEALGDVEIRIRAEATLWDLDAVTQVGHVTKVSGTYDAPSKRIEVARSMRSLAHEVLHALEHHGMAKDPGELGYIGNRRVGTWSDNGKYLLMLNEYESQARDMDEAP